MPPGLHRPKDIVSALLVGACFAMVADGPQPSHRSAPGPLTFRGGLGGPGALFFHQAGEVPQAGRELPKLEVAGSSPVTCSRPNARRRFICLVSKTNGVATTCRPLLRAECCSGVHHQPGNAGSTPAGSATHPSSRGRTPGWPTASSLGDHLSAHPFAPNAWVGGSLVRLQLPPIYGGTAQMGATPVPVTCRCTLFGGLDAGLRA